MYRNIVTKIQGKHVTITYFPNGSVAWFVYGIQMECPKVESYWSFVLLDQISEYIASRSEDEHICIDWMVFGFDGWYCAACAI